MARRLVGADHRFLMPVTGALGALLLLAADTVGRLLIGSGAFPVGVITSFMGAPMFLYLLLRGRR
jgi:iron complex transport system permease protein